jgi:hypothetical protein
MREILQENFQENISNTWYTFEMVNRFITDKVFAIVMDEEIGIFVNLFNAKKCKIKLILNMIKPFFNGK